MILKSIPHLIHIRSANRFEIPKTAFLRCFTGIAALIDQRSIIKDLKYWDSCLNRLYITIKMYAKHDAEVPLWDSTD
jgi:hypothetical protein